MKRRAVEYALQADEEFGWLFEVISDANGAARALAYVERLRRSATVLITRWNAGFVVTTFGTGCASLGLSAASRWLHG